MTKTKKKESVLWTFVENKSKAESKHEVTCALHIRMSVTDGLL